MNWRVIAIAYGAAALACQRVPTHLEVSRLADGEWIVLGHSDDGAIVRLSRDLDRFGVVTDRLVPATKETFSIRVGSNDISLARINGGQYYASLDGQPQLRRSPADRALYAFEHEDAIWVFKTPGSINKLTLDADLDTLRTRQREGQVILYWSVDPLWSGDGKFIAFLSNREAVRAGQRGQSIWMIDAYTGVSRALYDSAGVSVHTEGALGDEFVFISDRDPGVLAVDPRTRQIRKVGDGYVLASHRRGSSLVLNDNGRLEFVRDAERDWLPSPPAGHVWSTHGSISPDGERVALFSTDQAGVYMLHVLGGPAIPGFTLPAPPSQGPAWVSDNALIFSVQPRGQPQTWRAVIR